MVGLLYLDMDLYHIYKLFPMGNQVTRVLTHAGMVHGLFDLLLTWLMIICHKELALAIANSYQPLQMPYDFTLFIYFIQILPYDQER